MRFGPLPDVTRRDSGAGGPRAADELPAVSTRKSIGQKNGPFELGRGTAGHTTEQRKVTS
jgi:hypothetical protein